MAEIETVTLGGGCFWCLEPIFSELQGVLDVKPGYAGGHADQPTYRAVCSGTTGHAEVVRISFDPSQITFQDLLQVFFAMHDPTTVNRQGADVGSQYRSIILADTAEQFQEAENMLQQLERDASWEQETVVTQLQMLERFYPAEEYHWDYFAQNRQQGYCRVVIEPKLQKFRKRFADRRVDA